MVANKSLIKTKDITLIALLTTIVFIQEQVLTSLAGIQFTVFLIVLYSKKFGLTKSCLIVVLHVLLDCVFMGSLGLMYTPTMLIGWLFIPFTICTIFKKVENPIILALLGVMYSFIYSWLFFIPHHIMMNIDFVSYFAADVVFELVLAGCSFLTILWLYKPCSKAIDKMI